MEVSEKPREKRQQRLNSRVCWHPCSTKEEEGGKKSDKSQENEGNAIESFGKKYAASSNETVHYLKKKKTGLQRIFEIFSSSTMFAHKPGRVRELDKDPGPMSG